MIHTIKVKDYNSMQDITVGLAKNGYFVTTENVTDENYKDHWEIKYCESSEINKIPVNNGSDWDGDSISSMEIHNKDNTKGIKCGTLPDEKPSEDKNNPYELVSRDKPNINQDTSNIITDEQMTVITSVSGN